MEVPPINGNGKTKKVFIALPIYGSIDPYFFQSMLKLVQEVQIKGLHGAVRPHIGDSAVGRARNSLTREFLESDCTHLLFIDCDLLFSTDHIKRIMSHDDPIVGGLYCKKQEGPVQLVLNGSLTPTQERPDHLLEVRYIGTGFLRIAREVFEKMIERYGEELRYQCDHDRNITEYDFWQMGVYKYPDGTRRWLSEDWYFCQRALDLGYKVYADLGVTLKHSGGALFPLSYQEKQLFGKQPIATFENFECPSDCKVTVDEVFGGEYDFGIKFNSAPRIVDIGANVGAFALWANHTWPDAKLTCYEPDPCVFSYLQSNCRRIRASVVNAAVGDTTRNRLFRHSSSRLGSSQYAKDTEQQGAEIQVIDPSELPECELIKIDTEGAEADIVERLTTLPDFMLVEYHTKENKQRVYESLQGKMRLVGDKSDRVDHGIMAFKRV